MAKLSTQRVAGFCLFLATGGLTFMTNGNTKDIYMSIALCLAVFTSSHRAWANTFSTDPKNIESRSSSSSALSMLISVVAAVGLTAALTMSSGAPKIYVFLAAAPAFFATFNPVVSRIVPQLVAVVCGGALIFSVYMWPDKMCGVGLLYISFISQTVENIVFDRFITSFGLNLIVVLMEIHAQVNHLDAGLPLLVSTTQAQGDGGNSVPPIGFIWKSLKDVAIIGTLFPLLICFDKIKRKRKIKHRYFVTAFTMFSIALVGITAGKAFQFTADLPLCLATSTPVFLAVVVQSLVQGEFIKLISFNGNAQSMSRVD